MLPKYGVVGDGGEADRPADEILVRGSEEPPGAQSEVLLRAAKEQETPTEELLRVSQE